MRKNMHEKVQARRTRAKVADIATGVAFAVASLAFMLGTFALLASSLNPN